MVEGIDDPAVGPLTVFKSAIDDPLGLTLSKYAFGEIDVRRLLAGSVST